MLGRLAFSLIVLFATCVASLAQQSVELFGKTYQVEKWAIAKSTSARLVNVFRTTQPRADADVKGVYIPAGTLLAILNDSYRDRSGNIWELAITEDGVLIYIRARNRAGTAGGKGYYDASLLSERLQGASSEVVAVAQEKFVADTETYGQITITASEAYAVIDPDLTDATASILIDGAKMGSAWTKNEIIEVPKDKLAFIARDAFDSNLEWVSPFTQYNAAAEAKGLLGDLFSARSTSAEARKRIEDVISQKFLTEKSCEQSVSFDLSAEGELGVEVSKLLLPVSAKLGLSGNASTKTSYDKGEDFSIRRVKRDDEVYEIRTDRSRENCTSAPKSIRTSVSVGNRVGGEITSGELLQAGLRDGANGFPSYSCRSEYLALRDILSNKFALPQSISTFVIVSFGAFEGAADPTICKHGGTVRSADATPNG